MEERAVTEAGLNSGGTTVENDKADAATKVDEGDGDQDDEVDGDEDNEEDGNEDDDENADNDGDDDGSDDK